MARTCSLIAVWMLGACGAGGGGGGGDDAVLGEAHTGQYQLGPVEWTGSFHNACAPYPDSIMQLDGDLLAGVSNEVGGDGSLCDACVQIDTALGHTITAHVVTYGVSNAPGDLDISSAAFALISENEYPRDMTWRLVSCPVQGPIYVQMQTGANIYWSSLWIRNARLAVQSVAVKSANHPDFAPMQRGGDGTFTDGGGFGDGAFTLRVTAIDGSEVELAFDGFQPGELLEAKGNN
jgi:expansin (peptidoglycan-binding protein)